MDREAREDIFARHLSHLTVQPPRALYQHIASDMFHGSGGLEVCELKNADGEFGLRMSVPLGQAPRYFGVINIGDALSFRTHLEDNLSLTVQEDRFASSLFSEINQPESGVNVLVGAKKFIEGWSGWRVSAMGLLNVGKGEGPQVISSSAGACA